MEKPVEKLNRPAYSAPALLTGQFKNQTRTFSCGCLCAINYMSRCLGAKRSIFFSKKFLLKKIIFQKKFFFKEEI